VSIVRKFILPWPGLLGVMVAAGFVTGIEYAAASATVVQPNRQCVGQFIDPASEITVAMLVTCDGNRHRSYKTTDAKAVAAFYADRNTPLTCGIQRNGNATCAPPADSTTKR
jgi:hypothetical protein